MTLKKIRLDLGKKEFATGLTFVSLSRVSSLDDLLIEGQVDYSRVQRLGGKKLQERLQDFVRRYPSN